MKKDQFPFCFINIPLNNSYATIVPLYATTCFSLASSFSVKTKRQGGKKKVLFQEIYWANFIIVSQFVGAADEFFKFSSSWRLLHS